MPLIDIDIDWRIARAEDFDTDYCLRSNKLFIATTVSKDKTWEGKIDELTMDNRCLSPQAFASLASAGGGFFNPQSITPVSGNAIINTVGLLLKDGVSTPPLQNGYAVLYVDTSDGKLKIRFSNGSIATINTV